MDFQSVEGEAMTSRKRATPAYAWATVGKRSGKVLRDLEGHYSIWTTTEWAKADCPPTFGRVARVAIREAKPRPQRERRG
jgi:hypothetical protein